MASNVLKALFKPKILITTVLWWWFAIEWFLVYDHFLAYAFSFIGWMVALNTVLKLGDPNYVPSEMIRTCPHCGGKLNAAKFIVKRCHHCHLEV